MMANTGLVGLLWLFELEIRVEGGVADKNTTWELGNSTLMTKSEIYYYKQVLNSPTNLLQINK